jgi:hypothetical protein
VGLKRWGTALPVLRSGEIRRFYGAAYGRLKERKLGLSAVGRNCRCWRSGEGEKVGSVDCGQKLPLLEIG